MTTLAVFGGSFNPPHVAHQMVCLYILETQPVDGVVVVPCFRHPFDKSLAPFADRATMCRLAMAPLGPRVAVSELEAELEAESSRTLLTLRALAERQPQASWRLVIGADILPEREKWWRWQEIESLAPPLVVGRQGYPLPAGAPPSLAIPAVSSTEVRDRLRRRESVASLVPRSVLAFIEERGLYR